MWFDALLGIFLAVSTVVAAVATRARVARACGWSMRLLLLCLCGIRGDRLHRGELCESGGRLLLLRLLAIDELLLFVYEAARDEEGRVGVERERRVARRHHAGADVQIVEVVVGELVVAIRAAVVLLLLILECFVGAAAAVLARHRAVHRLGVGVGVAAERRERAAARVGERRR